MPRERSEQGCDAASGIGNHGRPYRILIADDEPSIRNLMASTLTGAGYTVRVATGGGMAVDVAATWEPDLIFLNRKMPILTGVRARRLKSEGGEDGERPIALVTGWRVDADRGKVQQEGFTDLLCKPFSPVR